jgi:hypothetical protein
MQKATHILFNSDPPACAQSCGTAVFAVSCNGTAHNQLLWIGPVQVVALICLLAALQQAHFAPNLTSLRVVVGMHTRNLTECL